MKAFILFLFTIFIISDISIAVKKNHHGKPHQHVHASGTQGPNDGSSLHQVDLKNQMTSNNIHKHEYQNDGSATPVTSQSVNNSAGGPSPTTKKSLLHATAQEHNVNKKQLDDQDGIAMESEHLIHVTPKPPTPKKSKKGQGQKKRPQSPSEGGKQRKSAKDSNNIEGDHLQRNKLRAQNKSTNAGVKRSGKKSPKSRKYPKKYNAQKHNLKKNQKEKKTNEKNKEKRDKLKDKREKRNKLKNHDNN